MFPELELGPECNRKSARKATDRRVQQEIRCRSRRDVLGDDESRQPSLSRHPVVATESQRERDPADFVEVGIEAGPLDIELGRQRPTVGRSGVGAAVALQAPDQCAQEDLVEPQLAGRGDLLHER